MAEIYYFFEQNIDICLLDLVLDKNQMNKIEKYILLSQIEIYLISITRNILEFQQNFFEIFN